MIKKNKIKFEKGFTLLELLVVIALMGIIYSVTLSNYNGMNKSIELQNAAYSLALSIRETQIYGINKRLDSGQFSDANPYPFGLHLDTVENTKIIIFRDKKSPINNKFDNNCTTNITECERITEFHNGIHISKIRVKNGNWSDFNNGKLNIIFKRPNPDAKIISESGGAIYSAIGIEISSKDGIYKACVKIGSPGNLSISSSCN